MSEFDIKISKSFSGRGYDIWLFRYHANLISVAEPMEIKFSEPRSDAVLLPDPTLYLWEEEFRSLNDGVKRELIGNGWMPKAEMLEGELKATKHHLVDMQKLIFEKILK